MENSEQKQDTILDKKMDDYSSMLRDFKADGELLVALTEQLKGAARLVKAFKMMGKEDEK